MMMLQSITPGMSGGAPNVMTPAGPGAEVIARLGTGVMVVAAIVFVVVVALLVLPILRRGAPAGDTPDVMTPTDDERGWERQWIVVGGLVVPTLIFVALLLFSWGAMRNEQASAPYDVDVIGHRWWWEVRYPRDGFTTANEIHIPTGVAVRIRLASADVIHSFWVPQLQGKTDAITGRVNETWLRADQPGVYRGECAEFCGAQHAHMAFVVVAESPGDYAAWVANQRGLAIVPGDSSALIGEKVFLSQSCAFCHTIRGTPAASKVGPDLTHLASRRTLAAGTMDFNRGNLAAWIVNPDRLKPGTLMPPVPLDGVALGALVAYLETLR